jgi:mRNA interferase MazF
MALVSPRRFEVWLIRLDPTVGSEIQKTRPCLVVSPDEMNARLRTVIVAPMTSARRPWPTRVDLSFGGVEGQVALDQLRAVDRARLARREGAVEDETARAVCAVLGEMFAL